MPVLPAEPFVQPQDLLSTPETSAARGCWWVLHTRSRAEKSLVRRLAGSTAGFFLPLHRHEWRSRGRLLSSYLPLFPGYVFLHGDETDRMRALETNLVAGCLPVVDQQQLRRDLERVYRLMASDAPLSPEARLQPGARVRVARGPLEGLDGKVLRHEGRLKLLIEVRLLQQGVSVEIESWMLEPVEQTETVAVS